jgi:competence protein ComEA
MFARPARALTGWLYRHDWQLAAILAVALLAVGAYLLWPRPASSPSRLPSISAAELETAQERTVIVYVSGAVQHPGLYTLASTLRVTDAIVAAGGLAADADPNCLPNLAAHVQDAKQIAVPFLGRCARMKVAKLDINSATREQLLGVRGIDAALADAIIKYREDFGRFIALSELKSAMGLDSATYTQLARSMTVN